MHHAGAYFENRRQKPFDKPLIPALLRSGSVFRRKTETETMTQDLPSKFFLDSRIYLNDSRHQSAGPSFSVIKLVRQEGTCVLPGKGLPLLSAEFGWTQREHG
jgi:hypothetical protein